MAVVLEKNEEMQSQDWNAYLINDRTTPIEMALIVTKGYDEKDSTSTMRHSVKHLPEKSYVKIEFLQDEVLRLNNEFAVTFFADGKMYEKKYLFEKGSITEKALDELPVMEVRGVLGKD